MDQIKKNNFGLRILSVVKLCELLIESNRTIFFKPSLARMNILVHEILILATSRALVQVLI